MPSKISLLDHEQLAALMSSLSIIAHKIERTRNTFPNYSRHLEEQYEVMMAHARTMNMLPPGM